MAAEDHRNIPGVPDYEPAELRRWALVVASFMAFLAGSAIVMRYLSRRIRKQPLWWDDYMIAFSMLWNWVVVAVALAMYGEGVGYHDSTIGPKAVARISKYLLVSEVIYIWHMCWTKISVLLMYYRVFHVPRFKKVVIGVGSFVVIWAITATFLFTFICVPTQKLWHPELPGHCVSEMGVWVANASSTIFSDIAILVLPIRQIWKLNSKRSEKIGLTFVFGLGFFTVFTSSYRVWVLFSYSKDDVSYTLLPLLVWTDIEMCAAVISACLPTLRPFLRTAAAKLGCNCFRRRQKSTTYPSSSGGKNTRGSQSTAAQNTSGIGDSSHRSVGKTAHTSHDDTDTDVILVQTMETKFDQRSKTGSEESWYAHSTRETDTDRDYMLEGDSIAMQPVHELNKLK